MADWQISGCTLLALVVASIAYTRWLEKQTIKALREVRNTLRDLLAEVYGDDKKLPDEELFNNVKNEKDLERVLEELEKQGIHAECIYKGKIKKGKK